MVECEYPSSAAKSWKHPLYSVLCVPEACQTLGKWLADMDPRLEAARAASADAHHDAFKGDCVEITCMTRVTEGGSELVSAKY